MRQERCQTFFTFPQSPMAESEHSWAHKIVTEFPPIMLSIKSRRSSYFEHPIQSLFNTCAFGIHSSSHIKPHTVPLKYWCPNKKSNGIKVVHLVRCNLLHEGFSFCTRNHLADEYSTIVIMWILLSFPFR